MKALEGRLKLSGAQIRNQDAKGTSLGTQVLQKWTDKDKQKEDMCILIWREKKHLCQQLECKGLAQRIEEGDWHNQLEC